MNLFWKSDSRNPWINFEKLIWQSDFNGYEMGYDEVNVVGVYMHPNFDIIFEIDMETMEILNVFDISEDEEHGIVQ